MVYGGYGRRAPPLEAVRRMEIGGGSSSNIIGRQSLMAPPSSRGPPLQARGMDPRGGAGPVPMDRPYKSWTEEPRAKMMRKEVEIIEVEKKEEWARKEEEERRRRARLREQEEAELIRNEEAARRKLQELERKEQEILEKERRLQEEIRRKEEQRRFEELRRQEERRLLEIRQREEELLRKEEKLKRMEMERRRNEEMLRLEDEQVHMERMRREKERSSGAGGAYPMMMAGRMHQSWVGGGGMGVGGYDGQRGYGPPPPAMHRFDLPSAGPQRADMGRHMDPRSGRPGGAGVVENRHRVLLPGGPGGRGDGVPSKNTKESNSSRRASAFKRLGPKMPVKARLGGSKPGVAR